MKSTMEITLSFHKMLRPLLAPSFRHQKTISHTLGRRTSIKDAIESFDIPHTEIGSILVNKNAVDFSYLLCPGDSIQVSPLAVPVDPCRKSFLRPNHLPHLRFLVDVNVAKLRTHLRMIGMDTLYEPNLVDSELAGLAMQKQCIVLSRDRGLLRRKIIEHGHLIRSQNPTEQLAEVLHYYGLQNKINPFSRCIHCNDLLQSVAKEEIMNDLEPLTKKHYEEFSRCSACNKIYWSGSHRKGMEQTLKQALQMHLEWMGAYSSLKE
ncbi:Mut7-C RNAse domain-containing protein [Desulfogranum marinum]|uniref:Mut7-C RNAse domain-containing protein n=1 Tax=Desulfogranum marinum TaxID=453220 RepID=UPI0029C94323|nr:Mut7-C RNAse domain-containing protein [Desulfogranum marinum]